MGSQVVLPSKPSPAGIDTAETTTNVAKLLSSIPGVKFGEEIRIGHKPGQDAHNVFPEFTITEVTKGLYKFRRIKYLGDIVSCCSNPLLDHYWQDDKNEIFNRYQSGRKLKTCDPLTKTLSGSTLCDAVLIDLCVNEESRIDRNTCNEWLGYALQRPTDKLVDTVNRKFIEVCSKGVNNKPCEDWLHHLRVIGGKKNDDIIDNILMQQTPDFKKKYMKCSFPDRDITSLSSKIIEPRECWDPECISANVHFLLSKNYRNLSLCHIYRCNISIINLLLSNDSSLKISCHNDLESEKKSKPRDKEQILKDILDSSFHLDFNFFFFLFILLALILIVLL
ncbi:ORF-76 [Teiidae poxvirus 1]|nr:ORF-76 [Teiidae poxvirus 1]